VIRVHYSTAKGTSFGRDFPRLDEALAFADINSGSIVVVDGDGVHVRRRFTFMDGVLTNYEVNHNGRMVSMLAIKENDK